MADWSFANLSAPPNLGSRQERPPSPVVEPPNKPTLDDLPVELKLNLMQSLGAQDILRLHRVNRVFRNIVDVHGHTFIEGIEDRERARLQAQVDYLINYPKGLPLLEAMSRWFNHRGIDYARRDRSIATSIFSMLYYLHNHTPDGLQTNHTVGTPPLVGPLEDLAKELIEVAAVRQGGGVLETSSQHRDVQWVMNGLRNRGQLQRLQWTIGLDEPQVKSLFQDLLNAPEGFIVGLTLSRDDMGQFLRSIFPITSLRNWLGGWGYRDDHFAGVLTSAQMMDVFNLSALPLDFRGMGFVAYCARHRWARNLVARSDLGGLKNAAVMEDLFLW